MSGLELPGIDPASWQVRLLPMPKRHTRGAALGFCGGHVVGRVERLRSTSVGCWWPGGEPELLVLEGHEVMAARAQENLIPGHRLSGKSTAMGAVAWEWMGERLEVREIPLTNFDWSWATTAGGGAVAGCGSLRQAAGVRAPQAGWLWRGGPEVAVVEADGDVSVLATDGTRLAGSVRGQALLWPAPAVAPIQLSPAGMMMSQVQALDGDLQVGVAWKGTRSRAGLWRGTADSFSDLTPKGFQTAGAYGGAGGYQVGFVRTRENTRNDTPGSDNRAALWQGAADRWFDLNALLPAGTYNASFAWAIEVAGDTLRICGEASRFEVQGAGTAHESHVVPVAHPVVWTARLTGG